MGNLQYKFDLAAYKSYIQRMGADNSKGMARLKKYLAVAMRDELTDRQRQFIRMYYADHMKMNQIAAETGVNISTVSRTLARARRRLYRCLRYGADRELNITQEE